MWYDEILLSMWVSVVVFAYSNGRFDNKVLTNNHVILIVTVCFLLSRALQKETLAHILTQIYDYDNNDGDGAFCCANDNDNDPPLILLIYRSFDDCVCIVVISPCVCLKLVLFLLLLLLLLLLLMMLMHCKEWMDAAYDDDGC